MEMDGSGIDGASHIGRRNEFLEGLCGFEEVATANGDLDEFRVELGVQEVRDHVGDLGDEIRVEGVVGGEGFGGEGLRWNRCVLLRGRGRRRQSSESEKEGLEELRDGEGATNECAYKKPSWVKSKKVPTMPFFVKLSSFISFYLQICHCFLFLDGFQKPTLIAHRKILFLQ